MKRVKIEKNPNATRAYRQLWRIVDGAIADVFKTHPEFLPPDARPKRVLHIRSSLVKRVTGQVLGYAAEAAKGRSGHDAVNPRGLPAADTEVGADSPASRRGGHAPPRRIFIAGGGMTPIGFLAASIAAGMGYALGWPEGLQAAAGLIAIAVVLCVAEAL